MMPISMQVKNYISVLFIYFILKKKKKDYAAKLGFEFIIS